MQYPKRLIEVDLPIKRISAHARREKSIRHGHISTLHIWWARRPLASCRAVLCASLWPDPADPLCPSEFIEAAQKEMLKWSANDHLPLLSKESVEHFIKVNHNFELSENKLFLRTLLLDFIADFANWDNSSQVEFLNSSRSLTQIAHISLGGDPGTNPLVVDPFAGGGSIPLEALRIGADAFASDLNPIPVLLNKVLLEYIPKYGVNLANELRNCGKKIQDLAEKELFQFYPQLPNSQKPIAYLWARKAVCEGPNCGKEIPLIRSNILYNKKSKYVSLQPVNLENDQALLGISNSRQVFSTIKGGSVSCPYCKFITPSNRVMEQLKKRKGGTDDSQILALVVDSEVGGRNFLEGKEYSPDNDGIQMRIQELNSLGYYLPVDDINPNRPSPNARGLSAVTRYGLTKFQYLYTPRQKLFLLTIYKLLLQEIKNSDVEFKSALNSCLVIAFGKIIDRNSSLCRWINQTGSVGYPFGRQALSMIWDFVEIDPLNHSGGWLGAIEDVVSVIKAQHVGNLTGTSFQQSATHNMLPDDLVSAFITDPPYYDAIPYSDLSDFFYVWLRPVLQELHPHSTENGLTPKEEEAIWNPSRNLHNGKVKDKAFYEKQMMLSLQEGRRITLPRGIGLIVFAHKSTSGWEAMLSGLLDAGWKITASWSIDTEREVRTNAINTASLASSVHLVCRPRENSDGSLIQNQIGDWRDVQSELPKRIHEWMPRLASEGVSGADAIFACIGPALEIFSCYTRVERPNGDVVSLREYLEKVWAAVSQEALNMVFIGGEAQGLEEDARLTAMWLWTITAGAPDSISSIDEEDNNDDEIDNNDKLTSGYTLEYDTARKIAQGLGANLEDLKTLVEVKGDKARLLPVIERTHKLFGSAIIQHQPIRKKKKATQLSLFSENVEPEAESKFEMPELKMEQTGKTVLDRLHQAMLLFSIGRTEALKRFLVEDGAGKDDRFWKLAQSLTSLYPKDTDERRWVEAVQTYKKSLGF